MLKLVSVVALSVSPVSKKVLVVDKPLLLSKLPKQEMLTLKKQAFIFLSALMVVSFMTIT